MRLTLQLLLMAAIIGGLLWYIGPSTLASTLAATNPEYVLFAFVPYFLINVLFTIRIMRVLRRQGIRATFGKTLLAQYSGMLTSDVTPGRSGYLLTPLYLKNQNIDASASLSCIMGIQSVEFLVKVVGGALALVFLFSRTSFAVQLVWVGSIGIGLMLLGGFALAAIIWFPRSAAVIRRIANWKLLARFTRGMMSKLDEFGENAAKTRGAIPEILTITLLSWVLKGFEWYFLGLAVGITSVGWLGFFLLHPLLTAFGFVPLTPSGIGFQEGAIVGIFLLLGVDLRHAAVFAILTRALLIVEDLLGVPQIAKTAQLGLFATTRRATPTPQR
jgi:uncharacterized protein (TIRG00374 family)